MKNFNIACKKCFSTDVEVYLCPDGKVVAACMNCGNEEEAIIEKE